jgi:NodT family efflux transporter outer membrane factor (OMF) lipoprotein
MQSFTRDNWSMCISGRNKRLTRLLSGAALFLLAGCTVGPDFKTPAPPAVNRYTAESQPQATAPARAVAQTFDPAAALPADWWSLFSAPALNQAVKEALQASPSIASTEATLRQAQDELKSGEGVFYPQVTAGFDVTREHPASNATPLKFQEGTFNLFTLSGGIIYTLDIFGGERRQVEGLGAAVDYQTNVARAAALTLASNVANTLIALAAYRAEIQATEEIVEFEKKQVALAGVQAIAGTQTYAAQLSLQSQLESTKAALPPLNQKVAQAEHLLAVLEGKFPAQSQATSMNFDALSLPQKLPLSLPSSLTKERPDILEAEANLHAASAQIGVATAAMLPNITLNGGAGYSATALSSLFAGPSNLWSLAGGITQPIFEGGTLYYRREAAKDAYDVAAANYQQTVLTAFQQVADTLRALEHDAEALAAQDRVVATAHRSLELVQANYAGGMATYSEVLIADAQYGQARIADIQANASRYQDTVALFAALGGGWWNDSKTLASR